MHAVINLDSVTSTTVQAHLDRPTDQRGLFVFQFVCVNIFETANRTIYESIIQD